MINPVKAHPTKVYVDYYGSSKIFDTYLVPGTQFTINITVDYVEDLWAYQFEIRFDPTILRGVRVENGPFLESAGGTALVAPGPGFDNERGKLGLFSASLFPKENFPTGGGVLAYVTFEVVGIGESPLDFGWNTALLNHTSPTGAAGYELGPDWEPMWIILNPDAFINGLFDNRPPVYVTPVQVKGRPTGENFTVSVNVADIKDLYAWSFNMTWDTSILNVSAVVEGDFLKGQPEGTDFYYEINNPRGYTYVNATTIGAHPGVDGSGTLANITFVVKAVGVSPLHLSNVLLLNSSLQEIPVRTADGEYLKVHDRAITGFTVNPPKIRAGSRGQASLVQINVTVANRGGFNETDIEVTVYYGENLTVGMQTIEFLEMGAATTLEYTWNTTGLDPGKYVLKAVVSPHENETNTVDNTFIYGEYTIFVHDIAITSVRTPVANVFLGHNVTVKVTVINEGTEVENFTVTAYYNESVIGTKTVTDFGYGASTVLEFVWDTTGVKLGNYTISAKASVVPGEEDIDDNEGAQKKMVRVLPLEEPVYYAEIVILTVVPTLAVGATILLYWRRRRISKAEEELFFS
jgi:hypothetical protein